VLTSIGRLSVAVLVAIVLLLTTAFVTFAEPSIETDGFVHLADALGDTVGVPITTEYATEDGTMQLTSNGAMYWHKDSGTVAFTDGYNRAALIGSHLVQWVGDQVDPPKPVVQIPSYVPNARVACIESKESGGENVWRDHTPPTHGDKPAGVLQYFQSTFAAHAAEMGHPEWSRWNPDEARAVAAYDLSRGRRPQWTVSGC
jgi:hypothetical protein